MESIYLSLHCHHQNDFCIKMGSDESYFNVSLIVRDKVTRPYSSGDNAALGIVSFSLTPTSCDLGHLQHLSSKTARR